MLNKHGICLIFLVQLETRRIPDQHLYSPLLRRRLRARMIHFACVGPGVRGRGCARLHLRSMPMFPVEALGTRMGMTTGRVSVTQTLRG